MTRPTAGTRAGGRIPPTIGTPAPGPSYGAIRGTLSDVRNALQRALDNPHGDAADAEVASRQIRTLTALRAVLPDLDPKPADLIDLEDRLDWVCDQLARAGGRADPG